MATAFKEKIKSKQLANHVVSPAAHHESAAPGAGGFMVSDSYLDLLNNVGKSKFAAKRCVQCGEVVDAVILRNRATSHEAMMAPPARVLSI